MAIRLEWLVLLLILFTVGTTMTVQLGNRGTKTTLEGKELEFINTTFIEVDTIDRLSKSFVQKGILHKGILYLEHLKYQSKNISSLIADNAQYRKSLLVLKGNIAINDSQGYTYRTQSARYYQNSGILKVNTRFKATLGKNIIYGASLDYNSVTKEMNATHLDAVIYTSKSKEML